MPLTIPPPPPPPPIFKHPTSPLGAKRSFLDRPKVCRSKRTLVLPPWWTAFKADIAAVKATLPEHLKPKTTFS
jgi:hypothetical protein